MQGTRRGFLAAGAAAMTATMAADADAAAVVNKKINITPFNDFSKLRDFSEAKQKLNALLTGTGLSNWLKVFTPSLDDHCIEAVRKGGNEIAVAGKFLYDPQLVEQLLASAANLLDQALSYRNELAALEISGVTAALQHYMTVQGAKIAESLVDITDNSAFAAITKKAKLDASAAHSDRGDALDAKGWSDVAKLSEEKETKKNALSKQQVSLILDAQSLNLKQLTTPGGGQNYSERYSRLLKYFLEDVAEAYQKCMCASLSTESMFGITGQTVPRFTLSPVTGPAVVSTWAKNYLLSSPYAPVPEAGGVLDALVDWCRRNIRAVELAQQGEVEFMVAIPLVQGWTLTPGAPAATRTPLVGAIALKQAMAEAGNGLVKFDIKQEHLSEDKLKTVRVIGVGLSLISTKKSFVYSAMVTGPKQTNSAINYTRTPVVLGHVRASLSDDKSVYEPQILSSTGCLNMNPLGTWSVNIRSRAVNMETPAGSSAVRNDPDISDIILHLRVRANLDI